MVASFLAVLALVVHGPTHHSTVSWYDDGGAHCCGVYRYYGFADCAEGYRYCYPMGTGILFCFRHRCHVGYADDHGPYVPGRDFDLNQNLASAVGLVQSGVGVGRVRWTVLRR